jgi:hypothetical protein
MPEEGYFREKKTPTLQKGWMPIGVYERLLRKRYFLKGL